MNAVQFDNVLRVVAEQQHGHLMSNVFVRALRSTSSPQEFRCKIYARLLVHRSTDGREFSSAMDKRENRKEKISIRIKFSIISGKEEKTLLSSSYSFHFLRFMSPLKLNILLII